MQPCLHIIHDQNNTIGFTHSIKVGREGGGGMVWEQSAE